MIPEVTSVVSNIPHIFGDEVIAVVRLALLIFWVFSGLPYRPSQVLSWVFYSLAKFSRVTMLTI